MPISIPFNFIILLSILSTPSTTSSLPVSPHSSCSNHPPYHHLNVLSILVSTFAQLSRLEAALKPLEPNCNLLILTDDVFRLGKHTLVLVNTQQYQALRIFHAREKNRGTAALQIELVSRHLSTLFATLSNRQLKHLDFERVRRSKKPSVKHAFYENYPSFVDLQAKWQSLAQDYPSVVSLETIGYSAEGNRPLVALTIGKPDVNNPRTLFITALQHAREWVAACVATFVAESLAVDAASGEDNNIGVNWNRTRVVIVPMVNPDGYVYSMEKIRYHRKNMKPEGWCPFSEMYDDDLSKSPGVDLNRNWGKEWGPIRDEDRNPCAIDYAGKAAFSEPETRAVRDLVEKTEGIDSHIDFHSYGQLVLSPWSFAEKKPERWNEYCFVGKAMAKNMHYSHGKTYTFKTAASVYKARGVLSDWMTDRDVLSFTVELRPHEDDVHDVLDGFNLGASEIRGTSEEGFVAVKALLSHDSHTYINSKVCEYQPGEDSTGNLKSSVDLAFIIGITTGGVLFVLLVVAIILVARAKLRPIGLGSQGRDADASVDYNWCPEKDQHRIRDTTSSELSSE